MKTKILSKLVLMGFTAVMIAGCGGASEKTNSTSSPKSVNTESVKVEEDLAGPCNVCEDIDHTISVPVAKGMIEAFHNTFINVENNRINNMGGIIDLTNWRLTPSGASGFRPLKMHYGLDKSRNLILTVETVNTNCNEGFYQGSSGFQSAKLLTSNSHFNPIKRGLVNSGDIDAFFATELKISASVYEIYRKDAEKLRTDFDKEFSKEYLCESMYFNPANSIEQINVHTNTMKFAYFFGYDNSDPKAEHKIRVILVGIDSTEGHLVLTDAAGNSLMRDYSRPYPIAKATSH